MNQDENRAFERSIDEIKKLKTRRCPDESR